MLDISGNHPSKIDPLLNVPHYVLDSLPNRIQKKAAIDDF
jgi:hypothetical protein